MKEKRIYFIIMSNVFHTPKEIHERFDLKGSLYKRETIDR
jgi:1-phosphatidylinositol-4-phosphate 5-kinase